MKKVLNLLLVLVLISGVAFADANIQVEVTQNASSGNDFIFEVEYKAPEVKKGESFEIQLPFNMNIDGKGIVDVEYLGGTSYKLVFLEDFINVRGVIGGKKTTVSSESLNPLIVNGKVITTDYNIPTTDGGTTVGEREQIYKSGKSLGGDKIWWSVVLSADKYEHMIGVNVVDEIGNGHDLDIDSVRFAILDENGSFYDDYMVEEVLDINNISASEIDFYVKGLGAGETININYTTTITDKTQSVFENQLMVEGKEKIKEGVYVEDWSDIDAEKPEPTEPTTPTDPNPGLPQVGESFFKIEYLLALLTLVLAGYIKRKE